MSPDEQAFVDTRTAAVRRARLVAVAEAVAWGVATAAITPLVSPVVAALVLTWRLRETKRPVVVRALERTHRDARNLFVTAEELLRGDLKAAPDVRQRVFARAAAESRRADIRAAVPTTPCVRAFVVAGAAWLIVGTSTLWRPIAQRGRPSASPVASAELADPNAIHVTVTLNPPAYTGLPASSSVDPSQIGAVEGTQVSVSIEGRAEQVAAEHDAATRTLTRDAGGRFVDRFELRKTGYYAIAADTGGRRVIPVVVSPDALPSVKVTAPGRDLVYAVGDRRVDFEVHATDDFGLRAMGLEYTKVSGSVEQFEFEEGQIPLTLAKSGDRDWSGSGRRSLAGLDLKEGDMLVYRAVATDGRPGGGAARSDAFFIEISKLAPAAGDAFTVPEEETRYALSQQMLIVKTERLEQKRASMATADFTDAALNLAVEQRMIRAELVFMLGGAIEDEDVEAEQSSELLAGRLQNRGQRDLRAATVAMSQAEKQLTSGSTREALTAERAAVAALQRAFSRDRYILRALGSRTELDLKRRLTGSLAGAAGGRRERPTATPNRRAALLQDLLAGIGMLRLSAARETASTRSVASDSSTLREPSPEQSRGATGTGSPRASSRGDSGRANSQSPARAIELAREALLIDASSAALRQAAADLQRVADTWSSTRADARTTALDRVASAVAGEAAHALASPPLPSSLVAPRLAGGFADALRGGAPK